VRAVRSNRERDLRSFLYKWDFWLALAISGVAGWFLTAEVIQLITTDLITFFGIQAAVVLPAMIFTAGILRPEGLCVAEAKLYGQALRNQMVFWIVLLVFDFVTVALLIIGKATNWMTSVHIHFSLGEIEVTATSGLISLTALFGAWALLRTVPFVKGVLSLQQLNTDLTEKAIVARIEAESGASRGGDVPPFRSPEGFGRVVSR
jgi:hypothetical protein